LHFSHEEVRVRIVGIQLRRLTETLRCMVIGAKGVPGRPQTGQHPDGTREEAIAFCENFEGRLNCAVHQEFSSPIEKIGFGWIQFRRALVLSHSFQRIAQSFVNLAQQVMRFGCFLTRFILRSQQGSNIRAGTLVIAGVGSCDRQFVGSAVVAGSQSRSPFQVGNCFRCFSFIDEQFPELVVGIKAFRLVFDRLAQRPFLGGAG
jgi:hypothetical protein